MGFRRWAPLAAALSFVLACRTAGVTAGSPQAPGSPAPPAAAVQPLSDASADTSADAARDERLLALLWFQTSAEYRVLATTAFHAAQAALDRALADPAWSAAVEQSGSFAELPPAVIADIDETMLDNSPYEAESILAGREHQPEAWSR